jgi:diguanylate cyclase (GGDEF)-like protein
MSTLAQFGLQELSAIVSALPDPVFVLTRSGRYAALLGGTDSRYYHDGSSLVGRSLFDVLEADKARWFCEQIAIALDQRQLHVVEYSLGGPDVEGLKNDGPSGQIWFEGRVQALDLPFDGEEAVLWVASNITARHALAQQLRQLSETDELSGLANRRRLMRALAERFDEHARYGTPCAVLSFDIDHFKAINDLHGHAAGDRAIARAAAVCQAALRSNDLAARLGGDEFVVLMPHTELATAEHTARRLASDISQALLDLRAGEHPITISAGVSVLRAGDSSIDAVLKRADQALYRAKSAGRNRVEADAAD